MNTQWCMRSQHFYSLSCKILLLFSFISYHFYHNLAYIYRGCASYRNVISHIIHNIHLIMSNMCHVINISCLPTYHIINHVTICIVSSIILYHNIYHIIHISYHEHVIKRIISFTNHILNLSFHNFSHITSIWNVKIYGARVIIHDTISNRTDSKVTYLVDLDRCSP